MKKTKKLLSLLLAATMLPAMAAMTNAETTTGYSGSYAWIPEGWKMEYNAPNMQWNKEQDYAGVAYNEGRADENGEATNALCFNIESATEPSKYIRPISYFTSKLAAGTSYRIGFWLKGSGAGFTTILDWGERISLSAYEKGETDGDWTYYYTDIAPAAERSYLGFILENKMNFCIDDVTVYELMDGDIVGENLISDGTFEKVSNIYKFDIQGEKGDYLSNSWSVGYHGHNTTNGDTNANMHYNFAQPTAKYARTGNYAMYLKYNGEVTANTYYQLNNLTRFNIEEGDYILNFWGKVNTVNDTIYSDTVLPFKSPTIGLDWYNRVNLAEYETGVVDKNGWKEYEIKYTYKTTDAKFGDGTNKLFNILVEDKNEMVIDDMKFYKVGKEDINLFADGGFENTTVKAAENEYTFNGWTVAQNNPDNPTTNVGGEMLIEPSDTYAISGTSAHFAYNMRTKANAWIRLRTPLSLVSGNTYTVSLKMKKINGTSPIQIATNFPSSNYQIYERIGASGWTTNDIGDGWIEYTKDFTLLTEKHTVSNLDLFIADTGEAYIDDISVTLKDGDGTNLVKDSGFENVTATRKNITNLMAYPANKGKALNISWLNPESYSIQSYKVYVDGVEYANEPVSLAPSAFNEMYIDGLENNKEYEIKLVEKDAGATREFTTVGVPDNKGRSFALGAWTIDKQNQIKNTHYPIHSNMVAKVDSDVKVSGESSLRLDYNIPVITPNLYPNILQNVSGIAAESKHTLKFKAKYENMNNISAVVKYNYTDNDGVYHDSWYVTPILNSNKAVSKDWTEYEVVLDSIKCNQKHDGTNVCGKEFYNPDDMDGTVYNANIILMAERGTGSVWFDDVSLSSEYAPNANILVNGGFDYGCTVLEPEYKLITGENTTVIKNLEAGTVEVTARIKNWSMGDDYDAGVAVALYNGTKLESVVTMEKKLNSSSIAVPADEFTATINVPEFTEDSDYKIKTIYWNGFDSLIPLDTADVLVPAAE